MFILDPYRYANAVNFTGYKQPGTITGYFGSGGVDTVWANYPDAAATDGAYATITQTATGTTCYLQAINFDFGLPSLATPVGVAVRYVCKQTTGGIYRMENIGLEKDSGTNYGDFRQDTTIGTSDTTVINGGPSDMWGTTFTKADFEQTDMGVSFILNKLSGATSQVFSCDSVNIGIYYI